MAGTAHKSRTTKVPRESCTVFADQSVQLGECLALLSRQMVFRSGKEIERWKIRIASITSLVTVVGNIGLPATFLLVQAGYDIPVGIKSNLGSFLSHSKKSSPQETRVFQGGLPVFVSARFRSDRLVRPHLNLPHLVLRENPSASPILSDIQFSRCPTRPCSTLVDHNCKRS